MTDWQLLSLSLQYFETQKAWVRTPHTLLIVSWAIMAETIRYPKQVSFEKYINDVIRIFEPFLFVSQSCPYLNLHQGLPQMTSRNSYSTLSIVHTYTHAFFTFQCIFKVLTLVPENNVITLKISMHKLQVVTWL